METRLSIESNVAGCVGDNVVDGTEDVHCEIPTVTHILDQRGDLWIHTFGKGSWGSSKPARFRVCSRTLARASSVFNALLYGGFSETRSRSQAEDQQEWIVELPADAALAMKQLFEIMHCQFHSLEAGSGAVSTAELSTKVKPSSSEVVHSPTVVRQLYDLTIVADKYDAIRLLHPWTVPWLKLLEPEDSDEQELLRKAWIYYQLGYSDGYKLTGTRLAMEFPPKGSQPTADPATVITPFHLINTIIALRLKMINSLLEPIRTTFTILLEGVSTTVGLCNEAASSGEVSEGERLDCESWMLGYMLRVLQQNNLWPLPPDDSVHLSPAKLATIVQALATPSATTSGLGKRHKRCCPSSASGSLIEYTYGLQKEEVGYMAKQMAMTNSTAFTPFKMLNCKKCKRITLAQRALVAFGRA